MAIQNAVNWCYWYADSFLIGFYRITGHPMTDYFIGTTVLAFFCVILGELSVSLAIRANKGYIDGLAKEMREKERLSFMARQSGDQAGYRALNKAATDAWGKHFFTMVAYSAGILWPIPFALGWMQIRFSLVEFPLGYPLSLLFGEAVGYTFTFIPIYILCRIGFKYLRPRLPYFRSVQKLLDQSGDKPH